jgi:hypothetical protein
MAERVIEFTVENNGAVKMNLEGFNGQGCAELADAFASLGPVVEEIKKPEYYDKNPNHVTCGSN